MTPRGRWIAIVIALLTVADRYGVSGQQAPAGLARVSGVVLTTEDTPRLVRRAIVSLRGSDLALGHHAITDDGGRFEIRDLPAGRYDLSAKRAAFVTIAYGASRPEWPGTPLALATAQHLSGLTLHLALGAVITGTVRDETGASAAALDVHLQRRTAAGPLFERYAKTDAHGVYRIYGLPSGAYTVSVQPLRMMGDATYVRRDAEVDAILQQLRQGRYGLLQALAEAPSGVRPSLSNFAPIYYPGALTSEEAIPVALAAGEERAGVDMTIRLVSAARLAGRVVASDGRPVANGSVSLVGASRSAARPQGATTRTRADGAFEFAAVSPGRYQLVTWRASSAAVSNGSCEFAATDVEATGGDPPEVRLVLRPCLKITGRVELAGDVTPGAIRARLTGAQVRFEADRSSGALMEASLPILAPIGADGMFNVGGSLQLVPGSYLLRVDAPDTAPGTGWWLQAARTADGRDILDMPLTLTNNSSETTNVVLTFTDRHTSLSGSLVTTGGRPAIDYTVIAFTANREWWRPPFRRVLTARPATNGAFLLRDLPPGEYRLAALADVAPNEWLDPVFLEQVIQQSLAVTIGPGEQKVQSIQIRGGDIARR